MNLSSRNIISSVLASSYRLKYDDDSESDDDANICENDDDDVIRHLQCSSIKASSIFHWNHQINV